MDSDLAARRRLGLALSEGARKRWIRDAAIVTLREAGWDYPSISLVLGVEVNNLYRIARGLRRRKSGGDPLGDTGGAGPGP